MTLDPNTMPLPLEETGPLVPAHSSFWISSAEFGELAGINRVKASEALRRCLNGGTWRETALMVRATESAGGKKAYQVYAPSMPTELSQAYQAKHPEIFKKVEVPKRRVEIPLEEVARATTPTRVKAIEDARFLEDLIMPAVRHFKYSKARVATVRHICEQGPYTLPSGKVRHFKEEGLSKLVRRYEEEGIQALLRKPRNDADSRRVMVSRVFDKQAPFPNDVKQALGTEVTQFIADLLVGTNATMPMVQKMASAHLVEMCRAKGWAEATLENCEVGIGQVWKQKSLRKAGMRDMNAGEFAASMKPRIVRTRKGLRPMEVVMGDVHPVDILQKREDGSEATARMVTWMDIATNRVFYTLYLLDKGKGITQAHIAASFVQMVQAWGLPTILYLDNGSEYSWREMMEGFAKLSLAYTNFRAFCMTSAEIDERLENAEDPDTPENDARTVVRSIPHNPQGKAAAEGLFGVLERTVFRMIPGWIGGDRTNKRTHKVGAKPRAYEGSFQQFEAAIYAAMDYYHRNEQKDGTSPNAKLAAHLKAGWTAVEVEYEVLMMAIAERKLYKVQTQGIEIAGAFYWHDAMANFAMMSETVMVYYAKWDPEKILFRTKTGSPMVAFRAKEFGVVDKEGAIESARRISLMGRSVTQAKKGTRKVDGLAAMQSYTKLLPPAPVVPFGPKITADGEFSGASGALERAGEAPVAETVRLLPGQWLDPESGEVQSLYHYSTADDAPKEDTWEDIDRKQMMEKGRTVSTPQTADGSGDEFTPGSNRGNSATN